MKVLFLGAAKHQTPIIQLAKEKNISTVSLDNRPENPGHLISDKSYTNISTTDISSVLNIAKQEQINGIIGFGSDIAAKTASKVSQSLELAGASEKTIDIFTNKYLFRNFLHQHQLQRSIFYHKFNYTELESSYSDLKNRMQKVVIKPIDSAGSKGVQVIELSKVAFKDFTSSFEFSQAKEVIIEEFVEKKGPQICGDGFIYKGKIEFICFGDGHFYEPRLSMAPYGETFPSSHPEQVLEKVKSKIEKILVKGGYTDGVFNFDVIIETNSEPFVIEIGPRSGGNYIPSAIKYFSSVDMINIALETALGIPPQLPLISKYSTKCIACYMVHSKDPLTYQGLSLDEKLQEKVIEINEYVSHGFKLMAFKDSSHVVANLILEFQTFEEMNSFFPNIYKMVKFKEQNAC